MMMILSHDYCSGGGDSSDHSDFLNDPLRST